MLKTLFKQHIQPRLLKGQVYKEEIVKLYESIPEKHLLEVQRDFTYGALRLCCHAFLKDLFQTQRMQGLVFKRQVYTNFFKVTLLSSNQTPVVLR